MKKLLVLLGIVAVAVTAWLLLPRESLPEFVEWVQGQGVAGALIIGAAYAVATVFMIPGSLITLGVGFIYGPLWGTALVSPASVTGATLAFLLGRGLARPAIEQKMAGNPRFQALAGAIGKEGWKILVLTRLSPVFPFTVLNYAFGLTRIRLLHYVAGSFVGMLPGTFLYVYLGSTLEDIGQIATGAPDAGSAGQIAKWAGLAATVLVTIYVTRVARRALAEAAPNLEREGAAS